MNTLFSSEVFNPYSLEHLLILIVGIALSILLYKGTKKWTYLKQRKILLSLSVIISIFQLLKIPFKILEGTFSIANDLPFHLCNFLPFFLIFVFFTLSRNLWAILFFWIILGCSQANFTPTVQTSLFHWDAIRYWAVHMLLVTLILYPIINWKWKLKHIDIWKSFLGLNILALLIYGVNLLTEGNYMYLIAKPPGKTLFSAFPEWPYYILVIQGILIIWSYLLYGIYLLFLGLKPKKNTNKSIIQ